MFYWYFVSIEVTRQVCLHTRSTKSVFIMYLLFPGNYKQPCQNTIGNPHKTPRCTWKSWCSLPQECWKDALKHFKQRRVHEFEVGESVSVRIPQIDRTCTNPQCLPCVVVEEVGKAQAMYRLLCESGFLSCCYSASDLEPYADSYNIPIDNYDNTFHGAWFLAAILRVTQGCSVHGQSSLVLPSEWQPRTRHHGMCYKATSVTVV